MAVNKSSKVEIIYDHRKERIYVRGNGVEAVLHITGKELKNMYWKGRGTGSVDVTLSDDD